MAKTSSQYWQILAGATIELRRRKMKGVDRVWAPRSGGQQRVFDSSADVIGYAGEAGGGKTDAGFGLAFYRHQSSILFRREYAQMNLRIVDRGHQLFVDSGEAKFNGFTKRWSFGRSHFLQLGAMKFLNDWGKYRGGSWDLMVFDEATEFEKSQVLSVMGWNRSIDPDQHCQTLMCFNPPSVPEGEWVIDYFGAWLDKEHTNPAEEGELRWYVTLDGEDLEVSDGEPVTHHGKTFNPRSRTFYFSRLAENPDLADTYPSILASLPYPLNLQLLTGDFQIGLDPDVWRVIPPEWVRVAQERWKQTSKPTTMMTAIGVDVARGGKAQTVIAPRFDTWYCELIKIAGKDTPFGRDVAQQVMRVHEESASINIDVLNVGTAAYEALLAFDVPVVPVNFGEGSEVFDRSGKYRLINKRAQGYWQFREALDPELGDGVCLPPDKELAADLMSPRYRITPRGILIEDKVAVKKRRGGTLDCGDAVVLASMYDGHSEPDFKSYGERIF